MCVCELRQSVASILCCVLYLFLALPGTDNAWKIMNKLCFVCVWVWVCSAVKDFISTASVYRTLFCLLHILSCLFAPFAYYICRLVAGKSVFQFLVWFFTRLYIIIFLRVPWQSFISVYVPTRPELPDQPTTDITFTFCTHTHTYRQQCEHTYTHAYPDWHERSPKKQLPACCLPIYKCCMCACQQCVYVCLCVHELFTRTHTHTTMFAHTHKWAHAQTEAQTLRNTKIVIFTFYADAALFSRMQLKNLLRSPLTILLSMFIPASAFLLIRTQVYSYFSSST